MKKKLIQRMAVICAMACIAAVSLLGQHYKTLVGTWNMASETDGGDPVQWTLVLKDGDGKLAAFLTTDQGEQAAKDFTYADGNLKFKAPYQGEDYDIELKVTPENKLDGTWTGGGGSGRTSGTKSESKS
jgi:hypothetical protein